MEQWFAIVAQGEQEHYGRGTHAEARRYCETLNRRRWTSFYNYAAMTPEDAAGLGLGTVVAGLRFADALAGEAFPGGEA